MKTPWNQRPKTEAVAQILRWYVPQDDPGVIAILASGGGLDGIYKGKSARIHRLLRLAYYRGIKRGIGAVWEGQQPVECRESEESSGA